MRWLLAAGALALLALVWLLRKLVEADEWHDSTTEGYTEI